MADLLPELPEPMGYVPFAGEFYQADQLDQEVKDDAETIWCFSMQQLRSFAEEAVRLEREAILAGLEGGSSYPGNDWGAGYVQASNDIAAGIRARSEQ